MAKVSLAVKYRPRVFEELVEQSSIKDILENQLRTMTTKNCYLFCGSAGTGKTTVARILANRINCGKGTPIEIDAASNNGVDNIRDIIDNAKFKALDADYKVYIVDECHALSSNAWAALLKLLEEPPAATIFILCTTDPQKIPATILSRVQRFDFKRLSFDSVVKRLQYIMQEERQELFQGDGADLGDPPDYSYEPGALEYIAKVADGGMRDAISLMDKCLSQSTELTIKDIIKTIGAADYDTMLLLLENLLLNNKKGAVEQVEQIYQDGSDMKQFVKQFYYFLIEACVFFLTDDIFLTTIPASYVTILNRYKKATVAIEHILQQLEKLYYTIKWEVSVKLLFQSFILQVEVIA